MGGSDGRMGGCHHIIKCEAVNKGLVVLSLNLEVLETVYILLRGKDVKAKQRKGNCVILRFLL